MIVKIQKSLNDNNVLIYSENREIMYEDTNPILNELLGNQLKGYFETELNDENQLMVGKKVKNQNW